MPGVKKQASRSVIGESGLFFYYLTILSEFSVDLFVFLSCYSLFIGQLISTGIFSWERQPPGSQMLSAIELQRGPS